MSVKASVSISEAQEAYARDLVAQGRYATLSAVVQQGLELLREQSQATDALRELCLLYTSDAADDSLV